MPELQPCGTYAAYQRHLQAGEDPCERCAQARRDYQGSRLGRTVQPRKPRTWTLQEQRAETTKRIIARNRERVQAYLAEHPCADCGETDIVVLDFHHLRDKDAAISQMVQRAASWERIEAEIAKCVVLCANDHRRRHHSARAAKNKVDLSQPTVLT